ncbi:hypothetical protein F7731_06155 [Cytobacillus depressus]|uniref:NAD(P)-dependent oxidoreductase n=1 Tax=Cytobacillus depressus TaxID=1602942 RepID=A0A6L3V6Z0_9BACI|nr:hypothetical protein [Cytobacillus depressus]KAB2337202.1 hypothetical protein F7731_06155 [Cytobacillus depressus]
MDRAVIIGAFEFLGFHFSKSLLEQGFEVVGIRSNYDGEDAYLIEKRMEIGRNGNYFEDQLSNWLSQGEVNVPTLFFIDYYGLSVNQQRDLYNEDNIIERFLTQNEKNITDTNSQIIALLPIQWLYKKNKYFNRIIENKLISHSFFLPAIYGPWQPNSFIFQQYLLHSFNPEREISYDESEWVHDILYVSDIVEPILHLVETKSTEKCILQSDIQGHWQKCAEFLAISTDVMDSYSNKEQFEHGDIRIETVKSQTSFSEGIENQKRQLMFLNEGRS